MLYSKPVLGTVGYLGGLPAVLEEFCWAFAQLVQFNTEYVCPPGSIIHYARARVSLHDFARNGLVEELQGDWLLQLDTDHTFEPDLLSRMLRVATTHALDVVTALYRHRAAPGPPVIYQWDPVTEGARPIGAWKTEGGRSPVALQIGSAGAGCLWVRRTVFDRIRTELREPPFSRYGTYGEDHAFFHRCKRLGIPVYALPAIEAPHLAVQPSRMVDYHLPEGHALDWQSFDQGARV